jgi:hypothetical protein
MDRFHKLRVTAPLREGGKIDVRVNVAVNIFTKGGTSKITKDTKGWGLPHRGTKKTPPIIAPF